MTATVVQGPDISGVTAAPGPASVTLLDVTGTHGRLVRRLAEIPPGAARSGTAGPAGELWFVIHGAPVLEGGTVLAGPGPGTPAGPALAGQALVGPALVGPAPVGPDHGVWLPPGTPWRLQAPGPAGPGPLLADPLEPDPVRIDPVRIDPVRIDPVRIDPVRIDMVILPGARADAGFPAPLVSDLRDCVAEVTGDRRFRVLFGPGDGGPDATQFVGEIPPGRAPEHRHPYDEVVLVLAGSGVVHLGDGARGDQPLRPGTCVHLPPGQPHCLENTGPEPLRVLGVFHPGGSPAAKLPAAAG
jgi:mannose-6-phosphate isomerase-like protein (cupin superfamily)